MGESDLRTLLLDRAAWDLLADAAGNIAVASDPYSKAQDAASAVRLFQGEDYYDTSRGVPYFFGGKGGAPGSILGQSPPLNYMRQKFIDAAMTVPGVVAAAVFFLSITGRQVSGQVQVTDAEGRTLPMSF